jgi:hypothetical protein
VLDRPITYRQRSLEEDKQAMIRSGVPEPIAEMNAQAFSLTAEGDAAWITDGVPTILGRPARSFEQFATDYAAAFLRGAILEAGDQGQRCSAKPGLVGRGARRGLCSTLA